MINYVLNSCRVNEAINTKRNKEIYSQSQKATSRPGSGISYKKPKPQEIYINRCCQLSRGRPVVSAGGGKRPKDCVRSPIKASKKAKSSLIKDLPIKLIQVNFTVL